jgi:hypothetical protein
MPSFKPKTTKKIKVSKKMSTTLDGKHKEFLNEFSKDETDRIPKLKKKRIEINKLLEKTDLTVEERLDYQDKLKEINEEITGLKSKKLNYFLDNSKHIFEYFENKKEISSGVQQTPVTSEKSKIIDQFFKIKTETPNTVVIEKTNNNIFQKYLNNIDESFLDINSFIYPTDVCQGCFKGELIPMDDDGLLSCNNCFKSMVYLIENEKPSYKEPPKEVCFYAYKKINHFKEILAQYQGKETTQIPKEVIENLKHQIKKERIDLKKITYYETKILLKKLGYNKYYEHINFIKDKLGIKPPIISQELEETLCNFFMEIQYPYARHCPDYRVNFLHYYYVLYKLFELLNEKDFLVEIPMLKDREKRIEQDNIWKKICEELDWEFIPTI